MQFQDGLSIEDMRELVDSRRRFVKENEGYIDNERAKLTRLEDELQQAQVEGNSSEVDRLSDRVRESVQNLEGFVDELAGGPRDVHDVYDEAPPNEDRRDGWARGQA